MSKKFPKTLYVKMDSDPVDKALTWPLPAPHMHELVAMGQTEKIGVYKLTEVHEATGVVSRKRIK